jgi:U2 small nuclear ribonucleoprotein A'
MVRLTPELIEDSYQYMNPVRDYELSLRGKKKFYLLLSNFCNINFKNKGYKIGLIENLGATLNQFDTIDFTDNDVRRLDGFPLLTKLKSLLFNNNKIQ